jgi:hypothetical protein
MKYVNFSEDQSPGQRRRKNNYTTDANPLVLCHNIIELSVEQHLRDWGSANCKDTDALEK